MKFIIMLMALSAGIAAALPVTISPLFKEARDTEEAVAEQHPVFLDVIRSIHFPRDTADEYNSRGSVSADYGHGTSMGYKRNPVLPGTIRSVDFPQDVVKEFNNRNPINTGDPKNTGESFKRTAEAK